MGCTIGTETHTVSSCLRLHYDEMMVIFKTELSYPISEFQNADFCHSKIYLFLEMQVAFFVLKWS